MQAHPLALPLPPVARSTRSVRAVLSLDGVLLLGVALLLVHLLI